MILLAALLTLNVSLESTQPPDFKPTQLQCSKITATFSKSTGVGLIYKSENYLTEFNNIDNLSNLIAEKCKQRYKVTEQYN